MPESTREGVGRRQTDVECQAHEKRADIMEQELKKQEGWLKASAGIVTVVSFAIGILCSVIISKLGAIESLLTDSKVILMQHSEQIKGVQRDVSAIQERHKYEDQSGHQRGDTK
jgi:hypothetical protein